MSGLFSFDGKCAVVTGAATGVGAALIELLAELGAEHVTVLDVKKPTGPHDLFLETDLSDPAAVDSAIAAIEGPVHALFNNAGVADTSPPRTVLAVNFLALRKISEGLADRIPAGGAIANTASTAGSQWPQRLPKLMELLAVEEWDEFLGQAEELIAVENVPPYFLSKELVQVYTMKSSRPMGRAGVRVNSVCPSPIDTPLLADFRATISDKMIDWSIAEANGRPVSPREVASVLAFLASDASAYVNGVNLLVDYGFSAAMTTGQADLSALA